MRRMEDKYTQFEKRFGISFHDKKLLEQAFTHRSYINENKNSGLSHNERLEFLGDAVLELIVTEFLFEKFPEVNEGILTAYRSALVRTETISRVARRMGMNELLKLSKGESRDEGKARDYILANTFEAFLGALHLDQGYEVVKKLVGKLLFQELEEIIRSGSWKDPKSRLQEYAQETYGKTPHYEILSATGPDHDKKFVVSVHFGEREVAQGEGKSKQQAQQDAAKRALKKEGVLSDRGN